MPLGARLRSIKNVNKLNIVRKFMCTLDDMLADMGRETV